MLSKNLIDTIGNTPLLRLDKLTSEYGCKAEIYAKLESFNPAGSIKDRVAKSMIDDAEKSGRLKPDSVIIEPTSGNTGIGLALIAAAKGYRIILTMPETMSAERRGLLKAYGAQLVLTPGSLGMKGAIDKANELAAETKNSFIPGQFENPANPAAHFAATGPEIWADTQGKLDIFVACVGTGGTVTGVGRFLKSKNPKISVVAVEPAASNVLSGGNAAPHRIQGIGAGFIPKIFEAEICDKILTVTDEEALVTGRALAKIQGLLAGISSGAAAAAAISLAKLPENEGKTIVTVFPDSGERYLSTALFE